jgi:hypothetical protein
LSRRGKSAGSQSFKAAARADSILCAIGKLSPRPMFSLADIAGHLDPKSEALIKKRRTADRPRPKKITDCAIRAPVFKTVHGRTRRA